MTDKSPSLPPPTLPQGWYARIRLLSLDVMLGALGSGWMVCEWTGWEAPWAFYIVLPLAVWVIYTADHLLDAYRLKENAHTPRHLFHHRYFGPLVIAEVIASAACLTLALAFLGPEGIVFGFWMLGLVILHLILVKLIGSYSSPLLIKESGVAFIYCYGIWGLPIATTTIEYIPPAHVAHAFFQFFLLALINLLEFSLFEHKIDKVDGHTSFVRAIGTNWTRRLLALLIAGAFGSILLYWLIYPDVSAPLQVIYLLMASALAAMLIFPGYFGKNERYRSWGDGAFLLPFLYPLLAWLM